VRRVPWVVIVLTLVVGCGPARPPSAISTATSVPPTPTPAVTATLTIGATTIAIGDSDSLVPVGQSVWEVPSTPDKPEAACASAPILMPYGLIAITPNGNSLEFRDQSEGLYLLQWAAANVYTYSGRSHIVVGDVTLTLTFTSPTTWEMHIITILDSDPGCQHSHDYAAVLKWVR
jgi:hypothetical protein